LCSRFPSRRSAARGLCQSADQRGDLTQVDPQTGYRPQLLIPKRQNKQLSTLFVLSFSGGGTRAAAFS